jgi:hypothetical protein
MQQYSNHIRYYLPHHLFFYSAIVISLICGVYGAIQYPHIRLGSIAFSVVIFLIGWLSFMLRQHYALTVQNRVVRLEMRLRYYQLTHTRLEDIESKLSFGQIAALRFASDAELPALVDRALQEQLTPDAIKRSIKNWMPDDMRV